MTPSSARVTHVFFGVGLTILVGLAPVVFMAASGPSASQSASSAGNHGSAALIGSFDAAGHPSLVFVAAGLAIATLLGAVFISTRVERDR